MNDESEDLVDQTVGFKLNHTILIIILDLLDRRLLVFEKKNYRVHKM